MGVGDISAPPALAADLSRHLLDLVPGLVCVCRKDIIADINSAGVALLGGAQADDIVGHNFAAFVDPGCRGMDRLEPTIRPLLVTLRGVDGRRIAVRLSVRPVGGGDLLVQAEAVDLCLEGSEREMRLQGMLDRLPEALVVADWRGIIQFANPRITQLFGHASQDLAGKTLSLLLPAIGECTSSGPSSALAALIRSPGETSGRRADGSPFTVEARFSELRQGGTRLLLGTFRDISQRKEAELEAQLAMNQMETLVEDRTREVQRLSRQTAQILNSATEGIIGLDQRGRITFANPAAADMLGWSVDELSGQPIRELLRFVKTDRQTGRTRVPPLSAILRGQVRASQVSLNFWRRDGYAFPVEYTVAPIHEQGQPVGAVVVFSDITQRKRDEERIRYQANYDQLTGLPNRALFLDRLNQAVAMAGRSGERVGLMFIDLDGFKLVNDTLGHDIGDKLLQEAAIRLQDCMRMGDTVARLGGDEFTIIMPNLGEAGNAPVVAQRIIESLERPFELVGHEAFVSASIGITVFPDDASDTANLLKNADAAMYRAKEQGKANYQFFTADLNHAVSERMVIKNGLSKALERNEFALFYQPKVDLAHGRITGVEALLRWRNAELGMVSPAKFVPVLEETGIIGAVGEWAIEIACLQHQEWLEAGRKLRVAVNLSVRQLRQPNLAKTVEQILVRTGTDPSGLELEITESMIMKDTENAVAILTQLSDMGIHLAMDDFGTGYSSLSYLKRFPLDTIKIDRSFIADIASDPDDLEIIKTIINMGHSLRRKIVAEGVETDEQRQLLKKMRCDEIQGFLISPPVPGAELTDLLAKWS